MFSNWLKSSIYIELLNIFKNELSGHEIEKNRQIFPNNVQDKQ